MSKIAIVENQILSLEGAFNDVLSDKAIKFKAEAEFAVQVLMNNDYSLGIAVKNPDSVRNAVMNLAAIGLSLNPAKKQAYLVPRKNAICLDISYMGLVELAIASGSVRMVTARLVHANDDFEMNGLDREPTHKYKPFAKDRGAVVGVFCAAKTNYGDWVTDLMDIEEVFAIRDRSESWKSGQKGPWKTDEGEMIKKTIVKRASKMWPKTDRLDEAIHHLNTDGGEGVVEVIGGRDTGVAAFDVDHWLDAVRAANTDEEFMTQYKAAGAAAIAAKAGQQHAYFKQQAVEIRTALHARLNPETAEEQQ
ncbi:recombinase RecT [Polynucleobacter sp. UK-Kesae-W10]|uniref:recombinase RecT n=1 Tax=Polynucleobacter sp. UK-Kesae-W10 TaxID=1819738 RepID=UPI001C0D11E2|nr:recombinase RecT [Polynucleobacter sp. UK-Kesae-W10]MBU3577503.1 recombinase RecT [Polynucleobacter sp. UK-Kesae-W10]